MGTKWGGIGYQSSPWLVLWPRPTVMLTTEQTHMFSRCWNHPTSPTPSHQLPLHNIRDIRSAQKSLKNQQIPLAAIFVLIILAIWDWSICGDGYYQASVDYSVLIMYFQFVFSI